MKKSEKKVENVKTLVIILLFLVVMLMVFLHFDELRKRNETAADNEIGSSFTLKSTFSAEIDTVSENMLLPSQIAFKKETNDVFAICSGKNYMQEIYSLLEDSISFMLSSKCTVLEDETKAFDDAISSNGFIYVRYHTPLPAVLLYLNSIEKKGANIVSMSDKLSSSLISEIILFPEASSKGSIFAFSREPGGKVNKYLLSDAPFGNINIADLEIYREAGAMVAAEFYLSESKNIISSTLIFDDMPPKNSLSFSEGIEGLAENAELQNPFAEMLNINPNKTGSYYDDELCGTVFMATHGTLSFTDDMIEYSTINNTDGISLSVFSGKDSETPHSMYECLTAAGAIASLFSDVKDAEIGDGQMLLTDLFRKGETLTLKFRYFYDNIPIASQNDALILEINAEKLTGIKFYPAKIIADRSNIIKSIPASWVISIAEEAGNENEKYTLIYRYEVGENGNLFAEWKPLKIKS